jgi:hypothetical protein
MKCNFTCMHALTKAALRAAQPSILLPLVSDNPTTWHSSRLGLQRCPHEIGVVVHHAEHCHHQPPYPSNQLTISHQQYLPRARFEATFDDALLPSTPFHPLEDCACLTGTHLPAWRSWDLRTALWLRANPRLLHGYMTELRHVA